MEPIKFDGHNIVIAENQPPYKPLPAFVDNEKGVIVTCWELSEEEKAVLAKTGKIYLSTFTTKGGILPQFMTVNKDEVIIMQPPSDEAPNPEHN